MKIGVSHKIVYSELLTEDGEIIYTEAGFPIMVGTRASTPTRFLIRQPCKGYYLRWFYDGWHYWHFLPGEVNHLTEGETYRTIGTRRVTMGSGHITLLQAQALRTILNTREVYMYTDDGWKNIRVDVGRLVTLQNQINGYEYEIVTTIGSKEVSKETGYTPVPSPYIARPWEMPGYDAFYMITILDGTFVVIITTMENVTITFTWGDGDSEDVVFVAGVPQEVTHVYNNPDHDEYVVTINNAHTVTDLDASDNDIIFFVVPETATELNNLDLFGNLIPERGFIIPEELAPNMNVNTDGSPMSDCDVVIGKQIWQCKNYDSYYPGYRVYNTDLDNRDIYGLLYKYSMIIASGFTSNNWRVSTEADWQIVIAELGGLAAAGGELKEVGVVHWDAPNTGAVDTYGFAALGGGYNAALAHAHGEYFGLKEVAYFITSTAVIKLSYDSAAIEITTINYLRYYSVRLIRTYKYLIH